MVFRNISFRYKIPLRASILIAFTAAVVTGAIMYRVYEHLKEDVLANSESLGRVLAHPLTAAILHDDVWRAYEIINSPLRVTAGGSTSGSRPQVIMVLDLQQKIYVSTQPKQYPMLSDLAEDDPDLAPLKKAVTGTLPREAKVVDLAGTNRFYIVTPIVSDDVMLATLAMGYSKSVFLPRFFDMARSAVIMTLLALAAVLPVTWYWAWRMAIPLTRLAECMGRVGTKVPDVAECKLYVSRDEIGQVGAAFGHMLSELKNKEALEAQMLHSERLAAVGRLAAGIAHEINNPLGGMLNAITTYRKHGSDDPQTAKTLSLIERGLIQIKDIIAALLVEARLRNHPLTAQDIEDTRTLVLSDVHKKSARFEWENDILGTLPLPSTLVRQILINLLLNAIAAVEVNGRVRCHIYRDSASMIVRVENGGQHIPPERMAYLFEPFSSGQEGGHGLGLWVIYQITQQMKGEIMVQSQPGQTCFIVTLPIKEQML